MLQLLKKYCLIKTKVDSISNQLFIYVFRYFVIEVKEIKQKIKKTYYDYQEKYLMDYLQFMDTNRYFVYVGIPSIK